MGWLQAWGPSLVTALEALQALATQRVPEAFDSLTYQAEWRCMADGHRYRAQVAEAEVSRLTRQLAEAKLLLIEARQYLPSPIALEDQIDDFLA